MPKPRLAHFSGPNATIQNTPPLVTSNKARRKYGLEPMRDADGSLPRFDVLRPQRLAAPVTVYVEQFSAHPLERDVAELYGPPDGYLDSQGRFHKERQGETDKPVYEVTLNPEDGLYPLPYMARQADGSAWEDDCAYPGAPPEKSRQPYFPDGSRAFEEIDRLGISPEGRGNMVSSLADVDFFRVVPPSGYTKGLPASQRTDKGEGDIPPERLGHEFFPYRPFHLGSSPPRPALATITNTVRKHLKTGTYQGAIWTQGSPRVEETLYWLTLMLDTAVPICGIAAQRTQGEISNDGPRNIADAVRYLVSDIWADGQGRDQVGPVFMHEHQLFAARDLQKADARPGGYVATGGHGGIIGSVPHWGDPVLTYLPGKVHTYRSRVNLTQLEGEVPGVRLEGGRLQTVKVPVLDKGGELLGSAIPKVAIVKDGNYHADESGNTHFEREVDLTAIFESNLQNAPLAGFVIEGMSPYGFMTSPTRLRMLVRAVNCGMPVVRVGRGNNEGFTPPGDRLIGGGNLTATKARLLLMACLLRFGALPPAADPDNPTEAELAAIRAKIALYQDVFNTH